MSKLGSENHIAKLTEQDVRDIRKSHLSFTDLAAIYGVTVTSIQAAATGITWGHIDTPIRTGRKSLKDRILEKVEFDTNGGCWLWSGRKHSAQDRGLIKIDLKAMNASRASFLAFTGVDPGPGFVCHKCDVPMCVNPDHLYLGDAATNAKDKVDRGRCGATGGGKPKLSPARITDMLALIQSGAPLKKIGKAFGVDPSSVRYWKRKSLAVALSAPARGEAG